MTTELSQVLDHLVRPIEYQSLSEAKNVVLDLRRITDGHTKKTAMRREITLLTNPNVSPRRALLSSELMEKLNEAFVSTYTEDLIDFTGIDMPRNFKAYEKYVVKVVTEIDLHFKQLIKTGGLSEDEVVVASTAAAKAYVWLELQPDMEKLGFGHMPLLCSRLYQHFVKRLKQLPVSLTEASIAVCCS